MGKISFYFSDPLKSFVISKYILIPTSFALAVFDEMCIIRPSLRKASVFTWQR